VHLNENINKDEKKIIVVRLHIRRRAAHPYDLDREQHHPKDTVL